MIARYEAYVDRLVGECGPSESLWKMRTRNENLRVLPIFGRVKRAEQRDLSRIPVGPVFLDSSTVSSLHRHAATILRNRIIWREDVDGLREIKNTVKLFVSKILGVLPDVPHERVK
jgi:hypothetical protein